MHRFLALLCAAAALLAQAPPPAQTAPAPDAPKPPQAAPPKPDAPKPFAEVASGATESQGLFRIWRSDEKLFLEIDPSQFDKLHMLSLTLDRGIGERGIYAAEMAGETPFLLRKVGRNVHWVAKNPWFRATRNTPMERTVAHSFTDSVIGISPIASQPHPDRKSILIDASTLFLTDLPILSWRLELAFRMPYRFDARASSFGRVRTFDKNLEIETIANYAAERPPVPPLLPPGATPPPGVPPPRVLPDLRSMLVHIRYSISEMPDSGYKPRLADDRVGYFVSQIHDFSEEFDAVHTTARNYINRWRLEKADPTAAVSRPKKPIVFWLETTIPLRYREAVRQGVLLWNSAFERIGFKDAVEARQQPDDADWDPADTRYNTIRWFSATDSGFAQGPSRANPYTGELYDADIRFSDGFARGRRRDVVESINPLSAFSESQSGWRAPWSPPGRDSCNLMTEAALEMSFGFDLLETRGMEPDGPEADKLANDYLIWITAHEVGHTLGLRHNFRSSSIRRFEDLHNADITGKGGLTGSVMDYTPINLAAKGAKQGQHTQTVLGPYDYWAIEYGYKPIDAATPEAELPELRKIASRAAEPELAYATDEDAGVSSQPFELDPLANRFDLGADPLQYFAHRARLAREIWANMEGKIEKQGEGYQVLRRAFNGALGQSRQSMLNAVKYIGGVYQVRDHVGDPNGRLPFEPVPAARQREALRLLTELCFSPGAYRFSPRLLNKLNAERHSDWFTPGGLQMEVPLHDVILGSQRAVLDRVFHPMILRRVIDSELRTAAPADRFTIGALFSSVQNSIWSEVQGAGAASIDSHRRGLQRAHLSKMMGMVVRDGASPEDARTMARHSLSVLRGQIQGAMARSAAAPVETRAHLAESLSRIDEALKAGIQRTAF